MSNAEDIEKVRQEIMRLRELLDIMRDKLEDGERAYAGLFSSFSAEEVSGIAEKDRQWKAAEKLVGDVSPLRQAVMQLRFDTHELERSFEELYDIIGSSEE
jgi:hypothetical protein